MIVQRLREIQNEHGYLPDAELRELAREIGVPVYRIEEVASFFPAFRQERNPPPYVEVRVCRDMACHLRGAAEWLGTARDAAGKLTDPGLKPLADYLTQQTGKHVHVEGVSCLGRCDRAPSVWVERFPDPHPPAHHGKDHPHEHAYVYNARSRDDIERIIRSLAASEPRPVPDYDATYALNADVPPDRAGAPKWQVNVYAHDADRLPYDAIRSYAAWLEKNPQPLPPVEKLTGDKLTEFIQKKHPFLWQMQVSTLLGMGGAGMPTYQKWLDVWQQPGTEKYIVCNGDESEPGTFKDRELLLRMPWLVVEGVILGGLLTGASAGYIYIRHEYPEQIAACKEAIKTAREIGACGTNIFGSKRSFDVEVFESPGGYICGEQSALLEAMEDRRSQPRNRPPELTSNGLRDRPTAVNNVETLAWAPYIAVRGGKAYADHGWKVPGTDLGFNGRRLFSISGDLNRPGVYEVPIGIPFGDLINNPEYCAGVLGGRAVKAIACSGPSGGLMPGKLPIDPEARKGFKRAIEGIGKRSKKDADFMQWWVDKYCPEGAELVDLLAVPLDLNFFRNLNTLLRLPVEAMLGAGIVVYADGADCLSHAVNFSEFYRNESCGKCVPCRLGSNKLTQIGQDLLTRRPQQSVTLIELGEIAKDVGEMTRTMQQTSICGLGYVAPIPLASALAYFPEDVLDSPAPPPRPAPGRPGAPRPAAPPSRPPR